MVVISGSSWNDVISSVVTEGMHFNDPDDNDTSIMMKPVRMNDGMIRLVTANLLAAFAAFLTCIKQVCLI